MAAARMNSESVKNVSACDWSNLVGQLTGKNQPGFFSLALDSNLCGCLKPELCAQSDRPVWPDEISSIFREVCVTLGGIIIVEEALVPK